jgi:hypothetical protein
MTFFVSKRAGAEKGRLNNARAPLTYLMTKTSKAFVL